jgi:hypothetical protein
MMAPDIAITVVKPSRSDLRFVFPAMAAMKRLVTTANAPEMAMPCPVMPSVTCRSADIGVSRLTGMNSDAISAKTQSVMANTPFQCADGCDACDGGPAYGAEPGAEVLGNAVFSIARIIPRLWPGDYPHNTCCLDEPSS